MAYGIAVRRERQWLVPGKTGPSLMSTPADDRVRPRQPPAAIEQRGIRGGAPARAKLPAGLSAARRGDLRALCPYVAQKSGSVTSSWAFVTQVKQAHRVAAKEEACRSELAMLAIRPGSRLALRLVLRKHSNSLAMYLFCLVIDGVSEGRSPTLTAPIPKPTFLAPGGSRIWKSASQLGEVSRRLRPVDQAAGQMPLPSRRLPEIRALAARDNLIVKQAQRASAKSTESLAPITAQNTCDRRPRIKNDKNLLHFLYVPIGWSWKIQTSGNRDWF